MSATPMPEAGLACLAALGTAYRGDWSDMDGRALRSQLNEIDTIIRDEIAGNDVTALVDGFYAGNGICRSCHSWGGPDCDCTEVRA
jgi:hypothetical protein